MRLFVSYAHVDSPQVFQIVHLLSNRHTVYTDEKLEPGNEWRTQLAAEIANTDIFIFMMTPESVVSEVCLWELDQAISCSRKILPLLLQAKTAIPKVIEELQYIDVSSGLTSKASFEIAAALNAYHVALQSPGIHPPELPPPKVGIHPPELSTPKKSRFQQPNYHQLVILGAAVAIVTIVIIVLNQLLTRNTGTLITPIPTEIIESGTDAPPPTSTPSATLISTSTAVLFTKTPAPTAASTPTSVHVAFDRFEGCPAEIRSTLEDAVEGTTARITLLNDSEPPADALYITGSCDEQGVNLTITLPRKTAPIEMLEPSQVNVIGYASPNTHLVSALLGVVRYFNGDFQLASDYFQQTIQSSISLAERKMFHVLRGNSQLLDNHATAAIESYDEALDEAHTAPFAYNNRSFARMILAVNLFPDDPELAILLNALDGDLNAAFAAAEGDNVAQAVMRSNQGMAWSQLTHRYDEARTHCTDALNLNGAMLYSQVCLFASYVNELRDDDVSDITCNDEAARALIEGSHRAVLATIIDADSEQQIGLANAYYWLAEYYQFLASSETCTHDQATRDNYAFDMAQACETRQMLLEAQAYRLWIDYDRCG